ncbi:MAG: ATP-binding protein [Solirubrobacteraceae bacterium]
MSRPAANVLSLDTTYPAVAESVGQARRAVAALAQLDGAGQADLERIRLAVSEAVSNAIIHAYAFEAARAVVLTAAVIDGELTVVVADDGCGFGGARESQGLGLGLAVMTQLCDLLTMSKRSSGGSQLEMRFRLTRGPARRANRSARLNAVVKAAG